MFLITEYCPGPFYMGWHLYLRDSKGRQQRNADGSWGWVRGSSLRKSPAHEFLATLGIQITGDGTCDHDGYAEVARRYPVPRQRIGKKPRGCIPIFIDEYGTITAVRAALSPAAEEIEK